MARRYGRGKGSYFKGVDLLAVAKYLQGSGAGMKQGLGPKDLVNKIRRGEVRRDFVLAAMARLRAEGKLRPAPEKKRGTPIKYLVD